MPRLHPQVIASGALLLAAILSIPATGEVRTWINPGDGAWGEAANWSGGVVPGEEDTAVITGNVTVSLRTSRTIERLEVDAGATLAVLGDGANASLTVSADSVNSGTILMSAIPFRSSSIHFADGANLTNNGLIHSSSGNVAASAFTGTLINYGIVRANEGSVLTVTGTFSQLAGEVVADGRLDFSHCELVLRGGRFSPNAELSNARLDVSVSAQEITELSMGEITLIADVPEHLTLRTAGEGAAINTAAGVTNRGRIAFGAPAVDGLYYLRTGNDALLNLGTIEAAGGTLYLDGDFVNRSTIEVLPDATIHLDDANFTQEAGRLICQGRFSSGGARNEVRVVGGQIEGVVRANSADLWIGADVGPFTIELAGWNGRLFELASPTVAMVSTGNIPRFSIPNNLESFGPIALRWAEVTVDDGATWTNRAAITCVGPQNSRINGAFTNRGTLEIDANSLLINAGSFVQSESGVLATTLSATDLHSRLRVIGSAEFAGRLRVRLSPGYEPALGDEFDIVRRDLAADRFSCDDIDGLIISESKRFKLVRTATTLSLVVVDSPELSADTNCDCVSDLTDLATVLTNFGTPTDMRLHDGDFNGDAAVDLTDLGLLLATFGTACP